MASKSTKDVVTNLRKLTPSRKRLKPGDIFAFLMPDGLYRFGCVVRTDARMRIGKDLILIYIYASTSPDKNAIPTTIGPNDLLIAPAFINRLPWSRGYFETVGHIELGRDDLLPMHVFRWQVFNSKERYFDEFGNEVKPPAAGIIGESGLNSFRTIDDEISRALGIQLAPD